MRHIALVAAFLIASFAAACDQGEEAKPPAKESEDQAKPAAEEPMEAPTDQAPMDEPPAEEAPTDASPMDEPPAEDDMAEPQEETQPQ